MLSENYFDPPKKIFTSKTAVEKLIYLVQRIPKADLNRFSFRAEDDKYLQKFFENNPSARYAYILSWSSEKFLPFSKYSWTKNHPQRVKLKDHSKELTVKLKVLKQNKRKNKLNIKMQKEMIYLNKKEIERYLKILHTSFSERTIFCADADFRHWISNGNTFVKRKLHSFKRTYFKDTEMVIFSQP
jgi:hypothetical protein